MKVFQFLIICILMSTALLIGGCSESSSVKTFTPNYTVIDEKDVSTGYAVRRIIRISIPNGLEKQVVEDNIVHAAKDVEKRYAKNDKGLAIDVYVFTHENVKKMSQGEYVKTTAECTYADNGEWTNSHIKYSPSNMKTKITYNENYFKK